jgi:hypothetical protein
MIKLKEEEMDFSEISLGNENGTISLGNNTGTGGAVGTGVGSVQNFHSESSSLSVQRDNNAKGVPCSNVHWATSGHKRNRFPPKYDAKMKRGVERYKVLEEV